MKKPKEGIVIKSCFEQNWRINQMQESAQKTKLEVTETGMTTKAPTTLEKVGGVAKEAGLRIACSTLVSGTKDVMVKQLAKKGGDSATMAVVTGVLDSEIGEAIVGVTLSLLLPQAKHLPMFKENKHFDTLSNEMQIAAAAGAGTFVVKEAGKFLIPALTDALKTVSSTEQVASSFVGEDVKVKSKK
jgi:hypothetical protein